MSQIPIELGFDNEYAPDTVSAPGETLQEILDERQMTQTDLASRIGLTHKTVNEIVRGKAPLTHDTALALETVLGIPASFWSRYETAYRESVARKEGALRLAQSTAWLNELPWRQAAKMGWFQLCPSPVEQVMEVLRFLGVASPKQYEEVYGSLAAQWKRSLKLPADPHAAAFWLRRGEIEACKLAQSTGLVWNGYDPRSFEHSLAQVRALTRVREPSAFVPELQRLCALAGAAVVFVPEIVGIRARGAARWLSPVRALIQLSLRYRTNDMLWFHFYHEAGHILKHSKRRIFVEFDGSQMDDLQEREADAFAQNSLIPQRQYHAWAHGGRPTKVGVESFAEEIGVDPGIVVGRLQKEGVIPPNWFNDLKQRYEWELVRG